jgi:hypothetical protein
LKMKWYCQVGRGKGTVEQRARDCLPEAMGKETLWLSSWWRVWWVIRQKPYMVDRHRIFIWNRTKKPLAIALSGVGRGLRERDGGGNLTKVQYKLIWNYHNESPCTTNIS